MDCRLGLRIIKENIAKIISFGSTFIKIAIYKKKEFILVISSNQIIIS